MTRTQPVVDDLLAGLLPPNALGSGHPSGREGAYAGYAIRGAETAFEEATRLIQRWTSRRRVMDPDRPVRTGPRILRKDLA
jgi:hypothetical protein